MGRAAPGPIRQFAQFPGSVRAGRLTSHTGEASIGLREMENRNLFISSCSRRQLARRRPSKSAWRLQLAVAMVLLFAAVLAFAVSRLGV
jgi:hypothetical protein